MKKHSLLIFTVLFCWFTLYGNNGEDPIVTLCSGKKMSWKEYQLLKALRSNEYDLEMESPEKFVGYTKSSMNNTVGAWSSVINLPIAPAAAANLPDGRIMTWSAYDRLSFGGNFGQTYTAIFDPQNNSSQELLIENTSHDMFCPGISAMPDGRIIVSGGSSSNRSSIYDPFTGNWSTADEMNVPRGYHSSVTLASGATFVIGGSWSGGIGNKDAEVWSEKTGWYNLNGVPVEAITDGINVNQPAQHDDYFPWLWVAPNGNVLHAGPSPKMHWIDATGTGSYTNAGNRGNDGYSISGTTVMYDIGKVLKAGGAGTFEEETNANNRTYTIDMNGSGNPVVTQVDNMFQTRNYHSSVVLPTGEVLVFGGIPISKVFSDLNSRLTTEIWNPNTQQWTQLAAMATPRNYHSVSLLMQDGRIFVGGGGLCGNCSTNHPDAEIFSPPYLFNTNGSLATRPVINSAPNTANYNSNITVSTNSTINNFSLVRMGTVTHSTNNEQRRIPLTKTNLGGNQYQLAITNRNILPPGRYMLFAMNNAGVPSVAKIIKIGDDINDCTPIGDTNPGGTGLSATYFNNVNFTNPVLERVDATIDFDWQLGSPAGNIGNDTYSILWEGKIQVPRSGTYTFYTNSDDGVRLWINNRLMVENWTVHAPIEDIGMITLAAGQQYDIKMEYYEEAGGAVAQLRWSGPGILKEIIPAQYLFPLNTDPCTNAGGDSDGDGICNNNDQCPNLDNDLFGISCNDNNPNTNNDVYSATSCLCEGTPVGGSCNVSSIDCGFTISGLSSSDDIKVFDASWNIVWRCDPWVNGSCDPTETISNLSNGNYFVQACGETIGYTVSCGGGGPCDNAGGDSDGDGVCNNNDDCPNLDNNLFGTSCDDNNPNTNNDVYSSTSCSCEGTPVGDPCDNAGGDSDGDGVCNNNDECPNLNNGLFGTSCNDNNPNTTNDVYSSASCSCQGTPVGGSCNVSSNDCGFTITGLSSSDDIKVFDASWNIVWRCDPWVNGSCDPTETISNLSNGNYFVQACGETIGYTVSCGGGGPCDNAGGDSDGDGVCNNNDDCPNLDNSLFGTSCDDNNPNTNNDVYSSASCSCEGTPVGGGPCDNAGGDSDGDGVCNNNDNCVNTANPSQADADNDGIGDACDTPPSGDVCDEVIYSSTANSVSISGLNASPISSVLVFNSSWATQFSCSGNCNATETVSNLSTGTYFIKTTMRNANWTEICLKEAFVNVGNGSTIIQEVSETFYFTVKERGSSVAIEWVTNAGFKTDYYEIEHSIDGENFSKISEQENISDLLSFVRYQAKDRNPETGLNYYRIKRIYKDGTVAYSEMKTIEIAPVEDNLRVYPNPTQNEIYVDLQKYAGQAATIQIHNLIGQTMQTKNIDALSESPVHFALANYKAGVYAIHVQVKGKKAITKLFVVGQL